MHGKPCRMGWAVTLQGLDQNQINTAVATAIPVMITIGLLFTAAIIVPLWVAFKKAGLAGPLSLIVLIPGIGFLLTLYILAFARWKVVPAPEYAYPPQMPPGYPPVPPHIQVGVPPSAGYNAPGAYTPAAPAYPPPSVEPPREY